MSADSATDSVTASAPSDSVLVDYVSYEQLAVEHKVSERTIPRHVAKAGLQVFRHFPGRKPHVLRADWAHYLRTGTAPPPTPKRAPTRVPLSR